MFDHIYENAGILALLSAVQEAHELVDRLRERVGLPTPHKGKPVLTRLREMEEFDRAEVCGVMLALARGTWDWRDNGGTGDADFIASPPSLSKFFTDLPRSIKDAAAQTDEVARLMRASERRDDPECIAAMLRMAAAVERDLVHVAKGGRRLFVNSGELHSMIERGWVEVERSGSPAWGQVVKAVDGFTFTGFAFEAERSQ